MAAFFKSLKKSPRFGTGISCPFGVFCLSGMKKKPRYPSCMFCRQNDYPITKEDVIPKWIARSLAGHKKPSFTNRTGRFIDDEWPEQEFGAVGKFGWEIAGPCSTRCNNGWMSRLELAAQPIMTPLMRGEACHVDATQILTLAQWAFKTTMMYEYLRYKSGRYFSRRDRYDFYQSRRIQPQHTWIFAARYVGESAHHSIGGPTTVSFPDTSAEARGYCATTAVGQLALQVLSYRPPEKFKGSLRVRVPARWDGVHKPVWPVPPGWAWPPRFALDDDGFLKFATRLADTLS